MKLLIFCPYYPPHIGGLESHADEFNKHLSQRGVEIKVFTPRLPEGASELETKYNNVKIVRFPAFEIIANYPLPRFWSLRFWRLFLDLFKENFDIVLSRTRFFNTSILAFFYAKIKHKKWIHIEHGSDFVKSGGKISTFIAKIYDLSFGKFVLRKADKVIANSKSSAEFCKKLTGNINCHIIYRGLEIEKIFSLPANLDLRKKYFADIIITFLGRLIDGKGVADLLLAVSKINTVNFKVFIIGDSPEKKNLENLAKKLRIEEKIIFFGYKKFDECIKILKISDIFVNPSYTEGLPTTVIEAALCKNAIIATDVGGTNEIFTDKKGGFLFESRNISELREKIEHLLSDKNLRENFGNNAYEEVKNKFNWKNSIEKYLKVFQFLI